VGCHRHDARRISGGGPRSRCVSPRMNEPSRRAPDAAVHLKFGLFPDGRQGALRPLI
jgi:hypothetical protein